MTKEEFEEFAERVLSDARLVISTIREKGPQYFVRPLGVGAAAIFFSYVLVYSPPVARQRRLDALLDSARATADYADQYKELHGRLTAVYPALPPIKDREGLLFNALVDSLKAENILPEGLRPPGEEEQASLLYQTETMTTQLKFQNLLSWMLRVESAKPALHISRVTASKQTDPIGGLSVTAAIYIIIPKVRY